MSIENALRMVCSKVNLVLTKRNLVSIHSKLQSSGCHSPKVHTGHMDTVEGLVDAPVARV